MPLPFQFTEVTNYITPIFPEKPSTPKNIKLGNVLRTISGDLITYNNGSKKEYEIKMSDVLPALYANLKTLFLDDTECVATLTDEYTDVTETFTCILSLESYQYNNNNDLLTDPLGGSSLLNYINYNYKINQIKLFTDNTVEAGLTESNYSKTN